MTETPKESWVRCATPAVADTIRWREPLWAKPNKPRGKPDKIGEQAITASVLSVGDLMELEVLTVKRLSLVAGTAEEPLKIKAGDVIRRKAASIKSGECQKLAESV